MGGESGSSNLILAERWCPNGGGYRGTPQSKPYMSSSEASSAMPTSSNDSDMPQQAGSGLGDASSFDDTLLAKSGHMGVTSGQPRPARNLPRTCVVGDAWSDPAPSALAFNGCRREPAVRRAVRRGSLLR